jgi:cysteinyl-tRNA synthetase
MQDLIRRIVACGYGRVVNGSVFFDVKKWADAGHYGKLLSLDLSQLKSGTRTLADEVEKEDLADFALWKAQKPGEPAWDFVLDGTNLPGRPGWHIECSAMEEAIFGLPFDIHTGGVDLVFPHHEDEIAQSACGYGTDPTRYFLHNEHLLVDGKKMSKSLGNFYTLRDLIQKGISAEAIRFFLVTSHYRSKLNLTLEALGAAESALVRLKNFARLATRGEDGETWRTGRLMPLIDTAKAQIRAAMDDDLGTPVAIAAVHELMHAVSPLFPLDHKEAAEVRDFFGFAGEVFGIGFLPADSEVPPRVRELFEKRLQARRSKDFAASDRLRDEIAALGYAVRDQGEVSEIFPLA